MLAAPDVTSQRLFITDPAAVSAILKNGTVSPTNPPTSVRPRRQRFHVRFQSHVRSLPSTRKFAANKKLYIQLQRAFWRLIQNDCTTVIFEFTVSDNLTAPTSPAKKDHGIPGPWRRPRCLQHAFGPDGFLYISVGAPAITQGAGPLVPAG